MIITTRSGRSYNTETDLNALAPYASKLLSGIHGFNIASWAEEGGGLLRLNIQSDPGNLKSIIAA
jgi:hypothetical protein